MGHSLAVAVIGAGPVGLAAAAQLAGREQDFVVLEAGNQIGAAIANWAHVRLFSPWRYNTDAVARELLTEVGWRAPGPDALPTGGELISRYLEPLAGHPRIAPRLRLGTSVTAISRAGYDRLRTKGRENAPFVLRLRHPDAPESELHARAVIDASGTWATPNVLGGNGLPADGEAAATPWIDAALPDVLGASRDRYAGRHTLVLGSGHSAATTLLALAELARQAPHTQVTWAIRGESADRSYGGGSADGLPARGALGTRLRELVQAAHIQLLTGFCTTNLLPATSGRLFVCSDAPGSRHCFAFDRVVAATGYRPDHSMAAELRLDVDPVLGSARALAPLIDPNVHSCGNVAPHGAAELAHPEPDYYIAGGKSYGRAPTFLLATGYEQVRSIAAELAGDHAAAAAVELALPETGVCSASLPSFADADGRCPAGGPVSGPVSGTESIELTTVSRL